MEGKEAPFKPVPEENKKPEIPADVQSPVDSKPTGETTTTQPKSKEKPGFFGRLFGLGQEEQPAQPAEPTPETEQPQSSVENDVNTQEDPRPEDHTSSWVAEKSEEVSEEDNASDIQDSPKSSEINEANEVSEQKNEQQVEKEPELDTQDAIMPESENEKADENTSAEEKQEQPSPVEDVKTEDQDTTEETKQEDTTNPAINEGKAEEKETPEEEEQQDMKTKEQSDSNEGDAASTDTLRQTGEHAYKATVSNEKGEINYEEAQNQINKMTESIASITDEQAKKDAQEIKDNTLMGVLLNVLKTNNDLEKNEKIAEMYEKMTDKSKADAIMGYSALKAIGSDKAQEFVDMITDTDLKDKVQTEIEKGDTIPLRILRKELWDQASKQSEESMQSILPKETINNSPTSSEDTLPKAA